MGSVASIAPCPKTVLIADEAPAGRELFRILMEGAGHNVIEASDGHEALRRAIDSAPDLIVLDLRMPGLDGFEVLRILRSDRRMDKTPIAALTASGMSGDQERALRAGFIRYIVKPIGLSALRCELEGLLA